MEQSTTREDLVKDLKEKLNLISQRLKERRGERAARFFSYAYTHYMLHGEENVYCSHELISDAWPKTKLIIDREQALEAQLPKTDKDRPIDALKTLIAEGRRIEEKQFSDLADEIGVPVDDLRWYRENFEDILSDEGYEEEGGDIEWGGYADFIEHIVTGDESEAVAKRYAKDQRLHKDITTCLESAKKHGNHFVYDEMLALYLKLREYGAERDWDSWRATYDIMYGDHQPEKEPPQVNEKGE